MIFARRLMASSRKKTSLSLLEEGDSMQISEVAGKLAKAYGNALEEGGRTPEDVEQLTRKAALTFASMLASDLLFTLPRVPRDGIVFYGA